MDRVAIYAERFCPESFRAVLRAMIALQYRTSAVVLFMCLCEAGAAWDIPSTAAPATRSLGTVSTSIAKALANPRFVSTDPEPFGHITQYDPVKFLVTGRVRITITLHASAFQGTLDFRCGVVEIVTS